MLVNQSVTYVGELDHVTAQVEGLGGVERRDQVLKGRHQKCHLKSRLIFS
jgi:hypothetical protein